jgi:hypothetical protein
VSDIAGRKIMQGAIENNNTADISQLIPGMYFVHLIINGIPTEPQKIIKL